MAVSRPILDKVISPDVVGALWPGPDTRPIVQPQPATPGLFLRDTQALPPPDPSDTFFGAYASFFHGHLELVHMPSIAAKKSVVHCARTDGATKDNFDDSHNDHTCWPAR